MKDCRFICFVICALCLFSCKKPQDEPQRDEALVLTALHDSVVCNSRLGDMTALQLTWTAGTNHGTGSAIAYTIDMNLADSAMEDGLHFEIGRTMDRTFALTHRQLIDSVLPFFPSIKDDEPMRFALRIRAKVLMSGEQQVSEILPVSIVRIMADTTRLYLIGDAMPNGWDRDHAAQMQWDMSTLSGYTWTGKMHKGEFKILATTEDWIPCYVRDPQDDEHMLYWSETETQEDLKWSIDAPGSYTIDVDTKARTIAVTVNEITEMYEHVYMIGDATPGGWSWDNITELNHPESNIFTYQGTLSAGELKFPTELKSDWSGEMLYAPVADCAPSASGTFEARIGGPDNKWRISNPGEYQIRINFNDTTISFVKL